MPLTLAQFVGYFEYECERSGFCIGGGKPVDLTYASFSSRMEAICGPRKQSGIYDKGGGFGWCRYQQILNGSFSAVSKPVFARK